MTTTSRQMGRGRPRKFDEQQALGQAVRLFRERGYAGTSMQALSEAMGMGEQSIYNAFGNKEAVFQHALGAYCSALGPGLQVLSAPGSARAAIERFFSLVIDGVCDEPRGCLVAQTCLTLTGGDTPKADRVHRHLRNIDKQLARAVARAIEQGETRCDEPRRIARFLTTTMQGIAVMARGGASKKSLRDVVSVALQVLD